MMDLRRLRHVAFALGALRGEQMSARGVLPHDFSRPGDLEPLRDGFSSFAPRNRLRHKARKIEELSPPDKRFPGSVAAALWAA